MAKDESAPACGIANTTVDATELRRQELLVTRSALQVAIFDSANFSSIATDAKGVIQIFNVGAERMLGYKAENVLGMITPANISDEQELIARAAALSVEFGMLITPGFEALVFKASRGIEDIYELTYVRADGSRFPAVVSVTALRDAQSAIIGYLLIGTDNTARQQAEEALVKAQALQNVLDKRLHNTLESITDGFFTLDPDGVFNFVNTTAASMLDSTRERLLGTNFWSDFPQLLGAPVREQLLEAVKEGVPIHLKACQLMFPDCWYGLSAFPSDEGVAIYFRDVTQSRADHSQLRLLESAVSRLNDIVLITEADFVEEPGPRIVFVNKAFERRTGYTMAEVLGKTPRILQGVKTHRAELDRIGQALRKCEPVRAELINYTKDGQEFWLELDIVPMADSNGWYTHWVAVERDVTERKLAEQAIIQLNSELEDRVKRRTLQLEAANKEMEAFSYSVSHDLRSPLNVINGFTQFLLKTDGKQLSEKGKYYLSRIHAGSIKMGDLIDGLLALAKISRGNLNLSEVNLTVMSHKLVQELRFAEPDRVVAVDIQKDLIVNGDRAMVTVVMQNLIANAWKFSAKASHARVEIGSETAKDGTRCIFVRDNGAGFDMAYADKLFEVFQRLHNDSEFTGTGIGLANVKRVIDRHGGRVWAEAAAGEGATFRFTLDALGQ